MTTPSPLSAVPSVGPQVAPNPTASVSAAPASPSGGLPAPEFSEERLSKYRSQYQKSSDELSALLDQRTGESEGGGWFDPVRMKLAQAFLSPTKTGGFGESLGMAAGVYADAKQEENKRLRENAMMRMKLSEEGQKMEERLKLQSLGKNILIPSKVKGSDGVEKTVYNLNPDALQKYAEASGDPIEATLKYAKMVPELRKAGLMSGLQANGTPFDALVMMAPSPAIKAQAERLAKQYSAGMIDEDKANTLANSMLTMSTAHMDRQQAAQFNQMMAGMQFQLNSTIKTAEELRKQEESKNKLTDQQKMQYRQVVVPIINEGVKAASAISSIDAIESVISKAPSGIVEGARAATWGKIFNTDENTAAKQLDAMQKGLITQIPRLPGSASNLDAQNLEKSIGKLSDPFLDTNARMKIIKEIKDGFQKLANRANEVSDYWDTHKSVPKSAFAAPTGVQPVTPSAPAQTGTTPSAGGAPKFKVIGVEKVQ